MNDSCVDLRSFLDTLLKDRKFVLQLAGEKNIGPGDARYCDLVLGERFREALLKRGIKGFFSHQARTIDAVRSGRNVVLMTPTASGKSLCYNIPVLEGIMKDPEARALYLFPLKGLEQDQFTKLEELAAELGIIAAGAVYDGDTPALRRREIRDNLPNVIFTNPDMLHLAILPYHRKWEKFFRSLKYVVIDEIHSYRGVFGSHMAQVFRRFRRICDFYGAAPSFIGASATIANAGRLAEDLLGLPFDLIDESGAPSAGKHFMFVAPVESAYSMATHLFVKAMRAGLRTIVFTKARKITELIYMWACESAPELRSRISPYRAGFLPEERREIEARLFSGDLIGVVSTSALELGVDIGGLDCCILCGYPGSVSSMWQRSGRVGRQGREALVLMIATDDALDHYIMRHPEAFFGASHESAIVDPDNRKILRQHLVCAAAELPLSKGESIYNPEKLLPAIKRLVSESLLIERRGRWTSAVSMPQRNVSIRAIGQRYMLINEKGRTIGELNGSRVFREAFPGAVYLHRGKHYQVAELDLKGRRAVCKPVKVDYYTYALSRESTEIVREKMRFSYNKTDFFWGDLRITRQVTGYEKKRVFDRKCISSHDLDLPEYVFETEGIWTVIEHNTVREIEKKHDLAGTLHAVEHAAIACLPLFALCDRADIGGLSHTGHPAFGRPAIFIYDGHDGGIGLTKRTAEVTGDWLKTTLLFIEDCPCTDGCPSCIQDPQCGNSNQPLDKKGAAFLLTKWLSA